MSYLLINKHLHKCIKIIRFYISTMLFFYYLPQNVTGERHDARRRIRDSQGSKLKPKQNNVDRYRNFGWNDFRFGLRLTAQRQRSICSCEITRLPRSRLWLRTVQTLFKNN